MRTAFFVLSGVLLFSLLGVVFLYGGSATGSAARGIPGSYASTHWSNIGCAYPNCIEGIGLHRPADLVVLNDWSAVNPCFYTRIEDGGFSSEAFDVQIGVLQSKFIPMLRPPEDAEQYYNWTRSINFYLRAGYEMPEHLARLPKPVVCSLMPIRHGDLWATQMKDYKLRQMEDGRV